MTVRLYYTDAALRVFDATVTACDLGSGRAQVRLDRTAFYPTSGGQQHDLGLLGGVAVLNVIDAGEAIVHELEAGLDVGRVVHGEIDWNRRFDHMQQHTGQHVLSAAFERLGHVATTSVHFGDVTCTIDLAREVSAAEVERAEAFANSVVFDDRAVHTWIASPDEAATLPLRKESTRTGDVRLVEITDCDLSACGGTHVVRTGQIGLIAVTGSERVTGGTRIAFVCGGRALRSHARLRDIVHAATRRLSSTAQELEASIERLQRDASGAERERQRLSEALAVYRASELRASAETWGGQRAVVSVESTGALPALKLLAQSIVAEPGFVALVIGAGSPTPVVIARSSDGSADAAAIIAAMVAALGGRGGGRPTIAQAGVDAAPDEIQRFFQRLAGS